MAGNGVVQSVDRALLILELLSDYENGISISNISDQLDLHKSTIHRLLLTLNHKGYVEKTSENKYKLTLKLFELGNRIIEKLYIAVVARPYLQELTKETGEVSHLVLREDTEVVYIDKVEPNNRIRMFSRVGARNPIYCTSVGKAIMAYLTEEEFNRIWSETNIVKVTENTITYYEEMRKTLKEIRAKGYAMDEEENERGIRCIGAPLFNYRKEVIGAISVSGPTFRVTEEKIEDFKISILKYGEMISRELGFTQN